MSLLDGLRHRLDVLLHRDDYERGLDEELRFHLELDAAQHAHASRGSLSSREAEFAARRRFGNVSYHKEEVRQMTGLGFMDMLRQDIRFAMRTFRRTIPFTLIAVLTLAIGIGANTAIFSAVDAMLLRPLPFPEPDRLMKVSLTVPQRGSDPARDDVVWSVPKFFVFRDAQQSFAMVSLWTDLQATIRASGDAERVYFEQTDSKYFPTLGMLPGLGRNFSADEDAAPGGPRVAVLSEDLWARRFNSDSSVLGKTLDVDGEPYTIVGVAPAGFRGLSGRAEFWVPILSRPAEEINEAWSHSYVGLARLKAGVTPEQAKAEVARLGVVVDRAFPHPEIQGERWGAIARELDATRVDPVTRRSLLVLLGAVGLVLLIACANVANLFLVRAAGRRHEIAVRLAVGASRGRLIRQLLTESVMLSLLGGLASVIVAWWGVRLLTAFEPEGALRVQQRGALGAVNFSTIQLDMSAFAFAAVLTVLTALVFGLVPALQATRPSLTGALKDATERPSRRLRAFSSRNALVVSEIALALVLLAGAGLMLRSLDNLLSVRPGIDPTNVLTIRITAPLGYGRDSLPEFYGTVIERLAAVPGVTGAALSDCPPVSGGCSGPVVKLHDRPPAVPGTEPSVGVYWMSPNWPTVMRIPLQRGRLFTTADRMGAQKVVIVNEAAARALWPGENPIGRPVSVGQGGFWNDTARVVGVIGDVRYDDLTSTIQPAVYLSYNQSPSGRVAVFLRTVGDPDAVIPSVRRAMTELAPGTPLFQIRTMEDRMAAAMSYERFSTTLLTLFAAVALALAVMGTYGVISFAVAQRTREIGIRVALGATGGDVMRLIIGQGMRLVVVGAVIGLGAAVMATRVLQSLLYGVAPSDPVVLVAIVALLGASVILASWIPARRASRVHPTEALREN